MNAYGECLPYAENRVTLHPTLKDKWGRPALSIDCSFKENERKMRDDSIITMQEMLEAAGAKNINVVGSMSVPGNANHEMGTIRMGNDPRLAVLDKWNRIHDVQNVYITDGSCMTSSASVNPSLTYMALTARAADHAVRALKKGDI
jgi:choline dehydrogenase-like flavoprotein